jgi:zeaxanthin glucosyltransferase
MSHFGVLCYKGTGHLNPVIALSRELISRGHRVTLFQEARFENQVRLQGLEFLPITEARKFSNESHSDNLSKLRLNTPALHQALQKIFHEMEISLRNIPDMLAQAGIDVLIVDEIILAGPTIAQILDLQYFIISTSVPHRFGWHASPRASGYRHSLHRTSSQETALLQVSTFRMRGPLRRKLDSFRGAIGLEPTARLIEDFPPLAHLTQLPRCLDMPDSGLRDNFYYTGPFVDHSTRPRVEFPWSRLDDRPMVYASLGTTGNEQPSLLRIIADACHQTDLQLVVSLGGQSYFNLLEGLAGDALVVKDAPQLELLKKAALVITHGGLNTVLETLMEGKPMVVIPIARDQPAVAARLARQGVAIVLQPTRLSTQNIRTAITKLLRDPRHQEAALKLQANIRAVRGLQMAADLIETALNNAKRIPQGATN